MEILEDIKIGLKRKEIAKKYNIAVNTITNIKKRHDLLDLNKSNKQKYNEIIEKEIVYKYLNGESAKNLCKQYGFKKEKSILDKVKKYGFKTRSSRESIMLNKTYDNFSMAEINNEFKAYYLGLLASDGYIIKNLVGIDLIDSDAIIFLSSIIGKKYTIIDDKNGNNKTKYRLALYNKRLTKELYRLGIAERKTKTIQGINLTGIELKFLPYVIRGLIDGDGWVRKDGKEFFICTASYDFAQWIKHSLEINLYMEEVSLIKNNGIYLVRTAIEKNIKILKLLVYNKPFGMKRKYNLINNIQDNAPRDYQGDS